MLKNLAAEKMKLENDILRLNNEIQGLTSGKTQLENRYRELGGEIKSCNRILALMKTEEKKAKPKPQPVKPIPIVK